jgi:hypothetical protein
MSKRVKTKWVVMIPEGASVKVAIGDEVEANEELLEISEAEEKTINVSGIIGILSAADKKKLGEKVPGMIINESEVIFESRGLFPKKIILPINGEIIKIDEFENLHFREKAENSRKICSPVKAKVAGVDGKSLELEFRAVEYLGRGINEGKAWGSEGVGYVDELADLSANNKGQIILTEEIDRAWVYKAGAVGVKGVVVIDDGKEEKGDRINFKLPILALEKSEWEELKRSRTEVKEAMINASNGRLLLVM